MQACIRRTAPTSGGLNTLGSRTAVWVGSALNTLVLLGAVPMSDLIPVRDTFPEGCLFAGDFSGDEFKFVAKETEAFAKQSSS